MTAGVQVSQLCAERFGDFPYNIAGPTVEITGYSSYTNREIEDRAVARIT